MPAMDSIAMVSSQIPITNRYFGQRTGMDGMVMPFCFLGILGPREFSKSYQKFKQSKISVSENLLQKVIYIQNHIIQIKIEKA